MSHFNRPCKNAGTSDPASLLLDEYEVRFKPSRLVVRAAGRGAPTKLKRSAAMPDHKVNIPISRDLKPWWRSWNDYPNPTLDAVLALFVIAVIVMVFWFLLMK
jgi:hypothetical protein